MGYLSEKAAYLQGLAEGMKLDEKSDEGKLLAKIIDVLGELAAGVDDIEEVVEDCEERIDDLEDFASDLCEAAADCEHDHCSCGDYDDDLEDDELDDMEFYEVECPHCEEKVYFDEDMVDSEDLICPNCGKMIEIDVEG